MKPPSSVWLRRNSYTISPPVFPNNFLKACSILSLRSLPLEFCTMIVAVLFLNGTEFCDFSSIEGGTVIIFLVGGLPLIHQNSSSVFVTMGSRRHVQGPTRHPPAHPQANDLPTMKSRLRRLLFEKTSFCSCIILYSKSVWTGQLKWCIQFLISQDRACIVPISRQTSLGA